MERFVLKGRLNTGEIEQALAYYVPKVNAEMGLEDKNTFTTEFLKKMLPALKCYIGTGGYILYVIAPNYWGEKELAVVSFYVEPYARKNPKALLELIRFVQKEACLNGCRQLVIGGHFNRDKMHHFFERIGFKPMTFYQFVKGEKNGN